MRACLVIYDVPTQSKVANPSGFLRRLGVRCNLSAWIIPEERVPWTFLERLKARGVAWHVVRFDEGEAAKLRAMAHDALGREVGRVRDSLAKSLARAQEQLDQAERDSALFTDELRAEALSQRDRYTRAVLRTAKRNLQAAEEASIAFDLLADMGELLSGLKKSVAAETEAYLAWRVQSGLEGQLEGRQQLVTANA